MAILVTGGTKGIGRAIALRFAAAGNDVFLNYRSDEAAASAAAAAITGKGARAHLIRADIGTPEGARAALAAVAARTDRLDQIVHCAVRVLPRPTLDLDPHDFAAALGVNGMALLYLVQEARKLLRRGSTVFFLSSRGGRIVVPNYAAVGVGKALGEALMRYLAVELAPLGVRANCVAPGMVDTEALRSVFGAETERLLQTAAAHNPSGRAIRDDDYTSLIEYLASPAAEMITGQVIFVNGGHNLSA